MDISKNFLISVYWMNSCFWVRISFWKCGVTLGYYNFQECTKKIVLMLLSVRLFIFWNHFHFGIMFKANLSQVFRSRLWICLCPRPEVSCGGSSQRQCISKFYTKTKAMLEISTYASHKPNHPLVFRFGQHDWDARKVDSSKGKYLVLGDWTKSVQMGCNVRILWRLFSKFGLFLNILVNYDWVLQWSIVLVVYLWLKIYFNIDHHFKTSQIFLVSSKRIELLNVLHCVEEACCKVISLGRRLNQTEISGQIRDHGARRNFSRMWNLPHSNWSWGLGGGGGISVSRDLSKKYAWGVPEWWGPIFGQRDRAGLGGSPNFLWLVNGVMWGGWQTENMTENITFPKLGSRVVIRKGS